MLSQLEQAAQRTRAKSIELSKPSGLSHHRTALSDSSHWTLGDASTWGQVLRTLQDDIEKLRVNEKALPQSLRELEASMLRGLSKYCPLSELIVDQCILHQPEPKRKKLPDLTRRGMTLNLPRCFKYGLWAQNTSKHRTSYEETFVYVFFVPYFCISDIYLQEPLGHT